MLYYIIVEAHRLTSYRDARAALRAAPHAARTHAATRRKSSFKLRFCRCRSFSRQPYVGIRES